MENKSWGLNSTKKDRKMSVENKWGNTDCNYHRGYANTMNVFVIIQAFIIPAIAWLLISAVLYETGLLSNYVIPFVGYIITAVVLWFNLSYKAKLFDNISRLAKNSEDIIKAIENQRKGD